MNRPLIAAAYLLLLASTPLCAQQERDLMLHADFDSLTVRETFPKSANGIEKAAITIGRQILGHNYYNPPNVLFLRQAVREIGPVQGILATSDRLLRASKIGTADYSLPRPPLGIEEGPEAYTPRALTATTLALTNESTGAGVLTATTLALTNESSRQAPGAVAGAADGIPGADLGPYEREAPGIPEASRSIAADYDFALYLIDNDLKQDALKLVSSPALPPPIPSPSSAAGQTTTSSNSPRPGNTSKAYPRSHFSTIAPCFTPLQSPPIWATSPPPWQA